MLARRSRRMPTSATMTVGIMLAAALVAAPSATAARAADAGRSGSSDAFHLRLLRAEPVIDSTVVGSPAMIRLWFSEPVRLKATSVKVTDGSGAAVGLGPLSRDTAATAPVVGKVLKALAPGRYTVAWRTMGRDSHVVKGQYTFTVLAAKAGGGR
jgi:methionine-rich copper-binding protein CopC